MSAHAHQAAIEEPVPVKFKDWVAQEWPKRVMERLKEARPLTGWKLREAQALVAHPKQAITEPQSKDQTE